MTPITCSPSTSTQSSHKRKMHIPGSKALKRAGKKVKAEVREILGLAVKELSHSPVRGTVQVVPLLFGSMTFSTPPPSPSRQRSRVVDIVPGLPPPPPLTIPASPRSRTSSYTLSVESHHLDKVSETDSLRWHESLEPLSEDSCSIASSSHSASTSSSISMSEEAHETQLPPSGAGPSVAAPRAASTVEGPSAEGASSPAHEELFTSPPQVYVEPEVPDPFLVDDPEDPMSEEETNVPQVSDSQRTIIPSRTEEIIISQPSSASPTPSPLPPLPQPNLNKDVPPNPPPQSEDDLEDEALDVVLPDLVLPTMFLPIPNTDPLSTLLTKYIHPPEKRPVRDVTGEWQRSDFHTLVMTNSWRALARMARDRIVMANPAELPLILNLWYIRLACLARLRLSNQTSAECTNLFTVLNSIEPPATRAYVFEHVLPFELEVLHARLKYWVGDSMAYIDALHVLLAKCRQRARTARKGDATTVAMWKERGARVSLIIASQLVEMKEFVAAARLLEPLCAQSSEVTMPQLRSAVARVYLQGGCLRQAEAHFKAVEADPAADGALKRMNAALLASANGDWDTATQGLREIVQQESENYAAVNNLSVALLSQGKLKEAIAVSEKALHEAPSSVVVTEPFLFNLSTLYELRSANALDQKRGLLVEVAKWSGDGLRPACLKLPTA
ncbi:hypothetical protein HGRIS_004998 [Hohenbuehelia grisea]|uniref:Trafficking protein particle complex subunit 12 n=1 Tax=Hohenbuehelia grisea TaxID=104357 RepID=A0ABR3JEH5_9AGAR